MTPLEHLIAAGKVYPNAWKQVEEFIFSQGNDLPKWPDWCFLPMSGWYSIVSAANNFERLTPQLAPDVGRLAAIGTWRYTQGIYRFDDDLRKALIDTELNGDIPVDVLFRLPEYCAYIETPGMEYCGVECYGFWSHLEWDVNTGRHELRLLLNTETELFVVPLHLGSWPLMECVSRADAEIAKHFPKMLDSQFVKERVQLLQPLIAMLLYICSDEPEISGEKQPGYQPHYPQPVKTKKGLRLFPPDRPRVWNVGQETGRQLREFSQQTESTSRNVRPHIRRQHWHGYWTGPKDKERRFVYRWIRAILVGS